MLKKGTRPINNLAELYGRSVSVASDTTEEDFLTAVNKAAPGGKQIIIKEAVQHTPQSLPLRATYQRIVERRGQQANIAKVAAARKLLTLVYYALRDSEIRCVTLRHA